MNAFYVLVAISIAAGFILGRRDHSFPIVGLLSATFVAISFAGIAAGLWSVYLGMFTAFVTCVLSQMFYVLGARIKN